MKVLLNGYRFPVIFTIGLLGCVFAGPVVGGNAIARDNLTGTFMGGKVAPGAASPAATPRGEADLKPIDKQAVADMITSLLNNRGSQSSGEDTSAEAAACGCPAGKQCVNCRDESICETVGSVTTCRTITHCDCVNLSGLINLLKRLLVQ